MNGLPGAGGVDLAARNIEVHKLTVYPVWAMNVLEGSPISGPFDVHVQLVLPQHSEALLLPTSVFAMRQVADQIMRVCGDATRQDEMRRRN